MSFNPNQARDEDGKWTATGSLAKGAARVRQGGPLKGAGRSAHSSYAKKVGRVDTGEYYRSHLKEPKGRGHWAFSGGKPSYKDVTKEVLFVPAGRGKNYMRTHSKAAKLAGRVFKGKTVYSQP